MPDYYNIHKYWRNGRETLHMSLIHIRYSCLFGTRG
jgi:hypothetical protein